VTHRKTSLGSLLRRAAAARQVAIETLAELAREQLPRRDDRLDIAVA
jgi:hypothetical protein